MARGSQQGQRNKTAHVLTVAAIILTGAIAILFAASIELDYLSPNPSIRRRRLLSAMDLFRLRDPRSVASKAGESQIMTAPSDGGGRQLIHVFNIYNEGDDNIFSPVGYEQWIMLASVRIAKNIYSHWRYNEISKPSALFDSVVIVCAVLEQDLASLDQILNKYCDRVSVLTRTVASENHSFLRPLPFLQDIINAGVSVARSDDFYLMFTNADISTTKRFYLFVERMLTEHGANSLSFNRKTLDFKLLPLLRLIEEQQHQQKPEGDIMIANDELASALSHRGEPITPDSPFEAKEGAAMGFLQEAQKLMHNNKGTTHLGHDCFVMHSSVVRMISLGEMFPGYPGWGFHLWIMLTIMAQGYTAIRSNKLGTFHVGDAGAWKKRETDNSFWKNYELEELRNIYWCPFADRPPTNVHHLQQFINCGKIFHPAPGSDVPSFVQPGYEQIFLEKFSRALEFEDGIPFTKKYNNRSRNKLGWLRKRGVELEPADGEDSLAVASAVPALDAPVAESSEFADNVDVGGPTFVFLIGLEGVGHHLIQALMSRSPNMQFINSLGLCNNKPESLHSMALAMFHSRGKGRPPGGLFNPHIDEEPGFDSRSLYGKIVNSMVNARKKIAAARPEDGGSSLMIPVNANGRGCGDGGGMTQMSYPNMGGDQRSLIYPNLDIYYAACSDAGVNCKHIYMYRDPHDVLASTEKRSFNDGTVEGIRLYALELQIIYGQLSHRAGKTTGCFGFLDANGSRRTEDIDRFGELFGWGSPDDFRELYFSLNTKDPVPMENSLREELVPMEFGVPMKAYLDIHERVIDLCYSSLSRRTS